jgi:hypothetical protein
MTLSFKRIVEAVAAMPAHGASLRGILGRSVPCRALIDGRREARPAV